MKNKYLFYLILIIFSIYVVISNIYFKEQKKEILDNLDKPSREAYPDCKWEKVTGVGLELWGQSCDFGYKKLKVNTNEKLSGVFLEDITDESSVSAEQLIKIFELKDKSINSVIPILANDKNWELSEGCAFTETSNKRNNVTRYILMPTGDALKKFENDGKNEPINSTCAGYGMGNDGVQYFEIHASNPNKALFLNIGQELPMFDENTILVK